MEAEFTVDAGWMDPFARENLKRSIIDQGRSQGVMVYIITESAKTFSIKLKGEHGDVQAYEAAVTSWFNYH